MPRLARLVSILLHPVFMPVYALGLMVLVDPRMAWALRPDLRPSALGMVAALTIVFPLISALLLVRAGLVSGLEMPRAGERIAPYTVTLFYYGITWYLLRKLPLHPAVAQFMVGAGIALLITLLVTPRWKISAHMVGAGGVLGALVALGWLGVPHFFPIVAAALILCGLLGTARLVASDHTAGQVYAGAALGFLCLLLVMRGG